MGSRVGTELSTALERRLNRFDLLIDSEIPWLLQTFSFGNLTKIILIEPFTGTPTMIWLYSYTPLGFLRAPYFDKLAYGLQISCEAACLSEALCRSW